MYIYKRMYILNTLNINFLFLLHLQINIFKFF